VLGHPGRGRVWRRTSLEEQREFRDVLHQSAGMHLITTSPRRGWHDTSKYPSLTRYNRALSSVPLLHYTGAKSSRVCLACLCLVQVLNNWFLRQGVVMERRLGQLLHDAYYSITFQTAWIGARTYHSH
jgi:hypothetical protein